MGRSGEPYNSTDAPLSHIGKFVHRQPAQAPIFLGFSESLII